MVPIVLLDKSSAAPNASKNIPGITIMAHCAINEPNIKNVPISIPITIIFRSCLRVGGRPMIEAGNAPRSNDNPAST